MSEFSKDDAERYLIEIGSWFGLSDKDHKKLFRDLSRVVHPDRCSIPPKVAKILKERGFPSSSSSKEACGDLYSVISGLYSAS